MFPHITDADYTDAGTALVEEYDKFPEPEPQVTTRVNVLGWARWIGRDYHVFRAQGHSHERAKAMMLNGVRRVKGLPEEPLPPSGDRIVGQLRIEGGAFVDEGEA